MSPSSRGVTCPAYYEGAANLRTVHLAGARLYAESSHDQGGRHDVTSSSSSIRRYCRDHRRHRDGQHRYSLQQDQHTAGHHDFHHGHDDRKDHGHHHGSLDIGHTHVERHQLLVKRDQFVDQLNHLGD